MAVAAIIATMRERGLAEADILAVVEAAVSGEKRSAGAIRQARYRERQRAQTVTSDVTNNVTSDVTEPSPSPPRDINSTPLTPPVSELRSESHPKRVRVKYSEQFDKDFWRPYPRTPIMSKDEAWKAWGKLSENERSAAVAAIPGFVSHCRANPTYDPVHACRFLSQRRFEGFAPLEKLNGAAHSKVFVIRGTEQWAAWLKHLGKQSMPAIERNGEYGWNFETEWPPDATVPNNSPLSDPFEARPSPRAASEREGEGHQASRARFAHAR